MYEGAYSCSGVPDGSRCGVGNAASRDWRGHVETGELLSQTSRGPLPAGWARGRAHEVRAGEIPANDAARHLGHKIGPA